jgi:hypothetical protein
MKTLCQKSALLFGAMLAVCALVVPSMASAASWSPIGTTHKLFMPDLVISTTVGSSTTAAVGCTATEFDADVVSASTIEIKSGSIQDCRGLAPSLAANCTVTATATQFPWTLTAPTTTNIQIHGIQVDMALENPPMFASCHAGGAIFTWTGTLTGGTWDPSATGADRRITFDTQPGTSLHSSVGGFGAAKVSGSLRDTTATLDLLR